MQSRVRVLEERPFLNAAGYRTYRMIDRSKMGLPDLYMIRRPDGMYEGSWHEDFYDAYVAGLIAKWTRGMW